MESRNEPRLPPPWISPAAGKAAREVRPVIIVPRRRPQDSGYDSDAANYIARVEAADGQELEPSTKTAINNFIVGCKTDGIWTTVKASCILAGARTLAGALVPLVGPAPTNFNFTSSDYDRKLGLQGNPTGTKYLNSNRNNNEDPQNNKHISIYMTSIGANGRYIGTDSALGVTGSSKLVRFGGGQAAPYLNSSIGPSGPQVVPGFYGASRSLSTSVSYRINRATSTASSASQAPENSQILVFRCAGTITNCRAPFYSIGENLDLALLDARVTTLVNSLASAIP
jgi:hypothetical protein